MDLKRWIMAWSDLESSGRGEHIIALPCFYGGITLIFSKIFLLWRWWVWGILKA